MNKFFILSVFMGLHICEGCGIFEGSDKNLRIRRQIQVVEKTDDADINDSLLNFNETQIDEGKNIILNRNYLPSARDFTGAASSWSYDDQGAWGNIYPFCRGLRQSPINIRNRFVTQGNAPCLVWNNYYDLHDKATFYNDGHTVNFRGPYGTGASPVQPTLSGGPLTGVYQLAGVHWHWGEDNTDGAEHSINSRKLPLEAHFVHFNNKYSDVSVAIASGDPEGLAVVGILFEPSLKSSLDVRVMVNAVDKAQAGRLFYPIHFPLSIVNYKTSYFTYLGSLTLPACAESVRWLVFEKPLPISYTGVNPFREYTERGKKLVDNFRQTQLLNGRVIVRNASC